MTHHDTSSKSITFKLYVVLIVPNRSFDLLSGDGRINMIVALSIFAVKSDFASVTACHAKLRSKYSRFAASANQMN